MGGPLKVVLCDEQRIELIKTRDHDRLPYMREKAAAILKVAQGFPTTYVASHALLKKHQHETISKWIKRYREEGLQGLRVKAGRGRKPVFFPSARFH